MNRAKAIKFWREIRNTTFISEAISKFHRYHKDSSERTLERYVQANTAFEKNENINDQALKQIASAIGWKVPFLKKVYEWWASEFRKPVQNISESSNYTPEILPPTEIQRHWDNLESLGKEFRDSIVFPDITTALKLNLYTADLTRNRPVKNDPMEVFSYDTGVSTIVNDPLFPYLKKHLGGNACWGKLDELAIKYSEFIKSAMKARKAIYEIFDKAFPDQIMPSTKEILVDSIISDISQRVSGISGIDFDYNITQEKDGWSLQLGAWRIMTCGKRQIPEQIIELHKNLHQTLPKKHEVMTLINAEKELKLAVIEFRHSLLPDDLLRKYIRSGHCELCS
ncbi:hypothetical protein DMTZ50_0013 [Dehalococcoides mccartyi]|uniref:hypothetical protein n=1 Tax=Dehalococcoides mccartyi TaxID=61435 RepID=UPI0015E7D684|nr:hypothetical protein [Dehalococcoides mccartyi]MBA2084212.1 hypothetical protein [Dehalococcoides mccartyi]